MSVQAPRGGPKNLQGGGVWQTKIFIFNVRGYPSDGGIASLQLAVSGFTPLYLAGASWVNQASRKELPWSASL